MKLIYELIYESVHRSKISHKTLTVNFSHKTPTRLHTSGTEIEACSARSIGLQSRRIKLKSLENCLQTFENFRNSRETIFC